MHSFAPFATIDNLATEHCVTTVLFLQQTRTIVPTSGLVHQQNNHKHACCYRSAITTMGKAERKGADQQQQQQQHNNNTKLGLGPLLSKPTGKASKPQLTTPPGKGASTSLAALKQMIDSQLRELNSKLDQDAGKMQRQFASISTALEKTAQGHSAQANKYFQDTATFMEQAKASHDQAVAKLTKISKDANTQLNRNQKELKSALDQLQAQTLQQVTALKHKASTKA